MKKFLAVILAALMLFTLAACGGNNATDGNATDGNAAALKLGLGISASYGEAKNADGDTNGSAKTEINAVAVLLDAEGKIADIAIDVLDAEAAWTSEGKAVASTEAKTKYELGTSYGMAAYGSKHDGSDGKVLEWYAQAAAFDAALEGKTAADFSALADAEGYGTGDLAAAGCTIGISDMIKAAQAAAA